ncbi:MAG: type II toxin-antitoxin system Phd/YefM family antitoxin [Nitrospirae bacterium]|nr:type II toxin-antitoxin system Phd/YefM family antitoxin [Nitrospirota bacterium]
MEGDEMESLLKSKPRFVYEEGKPKEVILDIRDWETVLERLEDIEDLAYLESIKNKPLEYRDFEDFMKEHYPGV